MKILLRFGLIVAIYGGISLGAKAAPEPSPWDQPAAALAEQIASILGPGQARLTVRNLSSIPSIEIPSIRGLLEQDLKAHGVTAAGDESANSVRVTLSENAHQRLWVAEVIEGDQMQVAMTEFPPDRPASTPAASGLLLRKDMILSTHVPVLSALATANLLLVLEPDQMVLFAPVANGWQEQKHVSMAGNAPLARDPRGILLASQDGTGFEAWLPGMHCAGNLPATGTAENWTAQCNTSDDPWAVVTPQSALQGQGNSTPPLANSSSALKAFYNATRNDFTGVVSPSLGIELPAFYSAALLPRAVGNAALLIAGIDGKVQLAENGRLNVIEGVRDWGSDLGVIHSGCGLGMQIIASSSGEAMSDSLRAYELPALEAVPVSAALEMQGTVTAIWPAPDAKSVYAAVRIATDQYEVDRVSALCN